MPFTSNKKVFLYKIFHRITLSSLDNIKNIITTVLPKNKYTPNTFCKRFGFFFNPFKWCPLLLLIVPLGIKMSELLVLIFLRIIWTIKPLLLFLKDSAS